MKQYPRSQWARALMALPSDQVIKKLDEISNKMNIADKALPQSGLGLLKMQDSAFEQPFFLGEIPFASACVTVEADQGQQVEGSAQIMDDDVSLAKAIAISDAILSAQLNGHEAISTLIQQGMALCDKEEKLRRAMLHKTAVDFSLLSEAEDE